MFRAVNNMTRREAAEMKLKHFNTGRPCKRNHRDGDRVCDRYTSTGACIKCSAINTADYLKQFSSSNQFECRQVIELIKAEDLKPVLALVEALNKARYAESLEWAKDEFERINNMPHPSRVKAVTPPPIPTVASSHARPHEE